MKFITQNPQTDISRKISVQTLSLFIDNRMSEPAPTMTPEEEEEEEEEENQSRAEVELFSPVMERRPAISIKRQRMVLLLLLPTYLLHPLHHLLLLPHFPHLLHLLHLLPIFPIQTWCQFLHSGVKHLSSVVGRRLQFLHEHGQKGRDVTIASFV